MQKIISRYKDATFIESFRNRYCVWKFGKPKHNYYVQSRQKKVLILDEYDEYIINNLNPGRTITYDVAGYYLDGAIDNLTVIELNPIVLRWYPSAIIDRGEDSVGHLYNQADNFIINNTIKLRWKTFDEYTAYWEYQSRFFKSGTQIFFSFRDIFIFHNRLKFNFSELLRQWIDHMESKGFQLIRLQHDLISIDDSLNDITKLPEISDMMNGNVKIHWRYK